MSQGQTISWGRIAVGLLIAINVVLVIALMRPSSPVEVTEPPPPVVTPSWTPPPSPSPTGETPEPTDIPEIEVAPPETAQYLIAPITTDTAWRATTGTCQAPGVVELTTDGGQTWSDITPEGAGAIVRLRPDSEASGFIIASMAADPALNPEDREDCETMLVTTGSAGATWAAGTGTLSAAWYLDPSDRDTVSGITSQAVTVCSDTTVDLIGVSTDLAHVLCANGDIYTTTDGGQAWDVTATVDGARAIAGAGESTYVATWNPVAECQGIALMNVDGSEVAEVACIGADAVSEDPTLVESVALGAVAGDGENELWVWLGDAVLRTNT